MTKPFAGSAALGLLLLGLLSRPVAAQQEGFGAGQDPAGFGPGRAGALYSPSQQQVNYNLNRYYYYPYVYFPHNYWPQQSPRWPEPPGAPYMKPPAYMAYPAFREPHWRYELFEPQRYYRGFHFWLDQF